MWHLLQATLSATGPSWQAITTVVIAALQALLFWLLGQSSQDRREMRQDIATLKGEVATLAAHVGVEGNGLLARFDVLEKKIDRMSEFLMTRGAQ